SRSSALPPRKSTPTLPIDALSEINNDWNLVARVPLRTPGRASALELQRQYMLAARRFVQRCLPEDVPDEVELILDRWEEALQQLQAFRNDANRLEESLGRIDWVTKRWMLMQLRTQASWDEKKKVDLRYHELSDQGYFRRLSHACGAETLTDEEQIQRATRMPPSDSPASRRSHLIREFADGENRVSADWDRVTLDVDGTQRVIRL
ncbi:MAG: proteasome accessory factor PafA2 family protein, partial [Planctomycetota bacterium]